MELVTPFVDSTKEVFQTMLACDCQIGEPTTSHDGHLMDRVTSMIGLSGRIVGSISISFKTDTAIKILDRILGIEANEVDDFVRDAIGELANTIAGKGKRDLAHYELDLGLPQVIVGEEYRLYSPKWANHYWLDIESELGEGTLDVGFDTHRSAGRNR
ncbi:MAG: chemotaxis protein CheX [Planctomycetaceae bacterium]